MKTDLREVVGAFDKDGKSVSWSIDSHEGYAEWVKGHIKIGHEIRQMPVDDAFDIIVAESIKEHGTILVQ